MKTKYLKNQMKRYIINSIKNKKNLNRKIPSQAIATSKLTFLIRMWFLMVDLRILKFDLIDELHYIIIIEKNG